MVVVRPETRADYEAVHRVNRAAFGRSAEAHLVDRLRAAVASPISLVAETGGAVVGHIFFSPVDVVGEGRPLHALGLAPMAVLPSFQRQGIGSLLVREGLDACRRSGAEVVFVLGHPAFYPRFGFVPAATHGMESEYDVPPEAFMVIALQEQALQGRRGVVRYRPEFAEVE